MLSYLHGTLSVTKGFALINVAMAAADVGMPVIFRAENLAKNPPKKFLRTSTVLHNVGNQAQNALDKEIEDLSDE